MTVFDNMAFGLKLEKRSKDEINERVQEAARILQIEDYLQRKPKQYILHHQQMEWMRLNNLLTKHQEAKTTKQLQIQLAKM